ncbi:hypothetical protein [Kitasatospora sp. CB02891]|uniref:hypothetical protein n=1 Tax=Kitasatospora sp. CB02891 TaxID=2020329 RepID=UPI000C270582|nr:hypothetical protein [Kitasatospora sp. CB02891]PJN24042.1 hypothetical protein CG736_19290 [Kitasatospora sp. CB02891]
MTQPLQPEAEFEPLIDLTPTTSIKLGDRVRTTVPVTVTWPSAWTAPAGTLGTIESGPPTVAGGFGVVLDGDPDGFPVALRLDEFEAAE